MGLIITHLLKVPLTENISFRTHLENLTVVEDLNNEVICKEAVKFYDSGIFAYSNKCKTYFVLAFETCSTLYLYLP